MKGGGSIWAVSREKVQPVPEGHVALPTYSLSDPRRPVPRRWAGHRGCLIEHDVPMGARVNGSVTCVTHGHTLAWLVP